MKIILKSINGVWWVVRLQDMQEIQRDLLKSDFGISQELLIEEPAEENVQAGKQIEGFQ